MQRMQDYVADKLQGASDWLALAVERMPAERGNYCPTIGEHSGRSALSMIAECVLSNRDWIATLERGDGRHDPPPHEVWDAADARFEAMPLGEAVAEWRETTARLVALIHALTDAQWESPIVSPWFAEAQTTGAFVAHPTANILYHVGQINYIQTLYGDTEM